MINPAETVATASNSVVLFIVSSRDDGSRVRITVSI
jgi:hypothetical protein